MRIAFRLASVIALALGISGFAFAADDAHTVIVGHIEGVINPITARYVDRLLDEGEQRKVAAVVLVIDTPGGLIDSTYKITGRMLNAAVPVITYVAPSGAHAASAGTFITLAGHVAAMAPSTNIGAAHPVDSSGGDIQGDLRLKAENDAVAQITNIARARGHNAQWAEDAVRKSVSIGVDEAVSLKVVDLMATDVRSLVDQVDGRRVTTSAGAVTLATKGASLEENGPNPFEALLHLIVDPQIAVLLFTVGTYGIIFELSNPSLIFPGIIGVIAIVLALFAFGTLDASAAGIALLIFSVVLFVAEIKIASHFLLTAGGLVSLVVGTIILFPPLRPTFPGPRADVDPVVIAFVALVSGVFFFFVARFALATRKLAWAGGSPVLVGATGIAKSDIGPNGVAYVAGEEWSARSESGGEAQGWSEPYRRAQRFVTGEGSVLMDIGLAIVIFAAVIVILILRTIIHIVPQYQRLVVLALGRYQKMAGPGLVLLLPPPIQVGINVDLREFVVEIPQQTCITKDNAPISIDFLIYQKVMEEQAADSILKIQNFRTAVTGIATTTLRAVIGDILLDDVLAKREQINEVLRTKLDEVTQRWGVKVTTVEIRELTPPRDVQEAMNRQLTAERTRRSSAILVAEDNKQSNILQAEGQRQSQILRAEGFALALDKINDMAGHADPRTITLQYLEALKALGASPSTKWVIPSEFAALVAPLAAFARGGGDDGEKKAPR